MIRQHILRRLCPPAVLSLLTGSDLRRKVYSGGVWLGLGLLSEQSVRFGRNIILARLLAPSAFGTMALVTSTMSILQTALDIGIRESLIQNPRGAEDEYINAAWWMAFGRASLFWAAIWVIAPWVGRFYHNADLSSLLLVGGAGLLFEGAMSARAYVAIKEMNYRKWALINHGGGIIGVLTAVCLSFVLRDVWALVIGYVTESAARCVLSHLICPSLPRLKWYGSAARDLWRFSRRMFGLSILNLIFARADIFVLARLSTAATLGLYTMAVALIQTPTSFLMNLLGQTILPAFAQVQNDRERINGILLKVTTGILLLGLPFLAFCLFCGRFLLLAAYGRQYTIAAGAFILACGVSLINLINGQLTSVFYALGKPHLHRTCVLLMAAVMIVAVYPAIMRYGMLGGQMTCIVAMAVGFAYQIRALQQLTQLTLGPYAIAAGAAAVTTTPVVVVLLAFTHSGVAPRPLTGIAWGLAGCAISYSIAPWIANKSRCLRSEVVA